MRNEKPGGKRKYKTRHLEGTNDVAQPSHEFASKVKEGHYSKSSSKFGRTIESISYSLLEPNCSLTNFKIA